MCVWLGVVCVTGWWAKEKEEGERDTSAADGRRERAQSTGEETGDEEEEEE